VKKGDVCVCAVRGAKENVCRGWSQREGDGNQSQELREERGERKKRVAEREVRVAERRERRREGDREGGLSVCLFPLCDGNSQTTSTHTHRERERRREGERRKTTEVEYQ
jgi:hypothetical protein